MGSKDGYHGACRYPNIWRASQLSSRGISFSRMLTAYVVYQRYGDVIVFLNINHTADMPLWTCPQRIYKLTMMTSSNGSIFRVTGPLCGEFTGPRWIPLTKASDAELCVFFDLHLNKQFSKQSWGWWFETPSRPLWRHCNAETHLGDCHVQQVYLAHQWVRVTFCRSEPCPIDQASTVTTFPFQRAWHWHQYKLSHCFIKSLAPGRRNKIFHFQTFHINARFISTKLIIWAIKPTAHTINTRFTCICKVPYSQWDLESQIPLYRVASRSSSRLYPVQ